MLERAPRPALPTPMSVTQAENATVFTMQDDAPRLIAHVAASFAAGPQRIDMAPGRGWGSRWERKRGAQSLTCDPPSPVPLATPQQQTYLCTSPECQCYVSHTPIPCLFRTLAEIADAHAHAHAHAHAPRYACCTHAKDTSMPARADNELHVTCVSWGTCVFHMFAALTPSAIRCLMSE